MAPARRPKAKSKPKKPSPRGRPSPRFVGRAGSPVLDKYPPKDPALSIQGRPAAAPAPTRAAPAASAPPSDAATDAPVSLISLERPFDIDEFSQLLGETTVRVTVPREALAEVLKRVSEFMGFGIYVYAVRVYPAPSELLKEFVVELQRVDFVAQRGWAPFEEKGRSESPFGPTGGRR
jgi:hypothetical protein